MKALIAIIVILLIYLGVSMTYFRDPEPLWGSPTNRFLNTTNDLTGKGIRLLAHRCGSYNGFESSLNAAKIAIANGAQAIDFDLVISLDGVPLVFHDLNLTRLTG